MARNTIDTTELTPFQQALIDLGPTDRERAIVLDVTRNTVLAWRSGKFAPRISKLIKHPKLLAAYLASQQAA